MVMVKHFLVMGNGYSKPSGKKKINLTSPGINYLRVFVGVFRSNIDQLKSLYNNGAVYTVLLLPFIDRKTFNRQTGPK